MSKPQHIEQLVNKFLDGRTSNAEEQELYNWFSQTDVPREWAELKSMFLWYSKGMPENNLEANIPTSKYRPRIIRWTVGWSIAAAIAISLGIYLWSAPDSPQQTINIYEGSYIVRSGIRCDDITYIESDIEQLLAKADMIEQHADELLAWADM